MIDFSNLDVMKLYGQRIAVHCDEKWKAEAFVNFMLEHYSMFARAWKQGKSCYDVYEHNTCYSLSNKALQYCRMSYYTDNGFEVVEFDTLISGGEDINDSGIDVEFLMK